MKRKHLKLAFKKLMHLQNATRATYLKVGPTQGAAVLGSRVAQWSRPAGAGATAAVDSIPGSGRPPVSLPGESHGQRSLVG